MRRRAGTEVELVKKRTSQGGIAVVDLATGTISTLTHDDVCDMSPDGRSGG